MTEDDDKFKKIQSWVPEERDKNYDVICLTTGRTGSTTLEKSFRKIGAETLRIHSTENLLYQFERDIPYDGFSVMDFINFVQVKTREHMLVIDVFRDPIDRKISGFFRKLEPRKDKNVIDIVTEIQELSVRLWGKDVGSNLSELARIAREERIDPLINFFNKWFLFLEEQHLEQDAFEEWVVDGLDVMKSTFDKEKKFSTHLHNNKTYVLLRFDQIENWEETFRDLDIPKPNYDLDSFRLISANLTDSKKTYPLYKKFLSKYTIHRKDFNRLLEIYDEKLHFFYTTAEYCEFTKKWRRKMCI